jgi:hypothetical protein
MQFVKINLHNSNKKLTIILCITYILGIEATVQVKYNSTTK